MKLNFPLDNNYYRELMNNNNLEKLKDTYSADKQKDVEDKS